MKQQLDMNFVEVNGPWIILCLAVAIIRFLTTIMHMILPRHLDMCNLFSNRHCWKLWSWCWTWCKHSQYVRQSFCSQLSVTFLARPSSSPVNCTFSTESNHFSQFNGPFFHQGATYWQQSYDSWRQYVLSKTGRLRCQQTCNGVTCKRACTTSRWWVFDEQ